MLNIWELKSKADKEKAEGRHGKKVTGAQLRVQKDISEITLPENMELEFPDPNDLMHFRLKLYADEGLYKGGKFSFSFSINQNYPIEPPKVRCDQKIYHPNVDLVGNVCLNILREDWKPVLSLDQVTVGIQFLFLEPNQNDPLNKAAARSLQQHPAVFAQEVQRSMRGQVVGGEVFDKVV